jgi:hypothetical protein
MKKTLLALLITQAAALPLFAQNRIDPDGGFVVVLPRLPNGETRYPGLPEYVSYWQNGTHYEATGGRGYLELRNPADTLVTVANTMTDGRIYSSERRTGDLTIDSANSFKLSHGGESAIRLIVTITNVVHPGARNVYINEGIYENRSSSGYHPGANILATGSVYLNNATFTGGVTPSWSAQMSSGGLRVQAPNIIINNESRVADNYISGGDARDLRTWRGHDSFPYQRRIRRRLWPKFSWCKKSNCYQSICICR